MNLTTDNYLYYTVHIYKYRNNFLLSQSEEIMIKSTNYIHVYIHVYETLQPHMYMYIDLYHDHPSHSSPRLVRNVYYTSIGLSQLVHPIASAGSTIGRTDDSKDWAVYNIHVHSDAVLDPGGIHWTSSHVSPLTNPTTYWYVRALCRRTRPPHHTYTYRCRIWHSFSLKAGTHAELEPGTTCTGVMHDQSNHRLQGPIHRGATSNFNDSNGKPNT
jgi:hypothetical protein